VRRTWDWPALAALAVIALWATASVVIAGQA
jgi:CHASE2 domain-containing sensor protein